MLLGVLFFGMCAFAAEGQGAEQYCNDRYGFCVSYPKDFKMDPAPENDDGRVLHGPGGFTLTVSGINNVMEETRESEMSSQSKDFDKITYRSKGPDWFVLSGVKGGKVMYYKTYTGPGCFNHLRIEYPAAAKATADKIAAEIARSFKPGDLKEAD